MCLWDFVYSVGTHCFNFIYRFEEMAILWCSLIAVAVALLAFIIATHPELVLKIPNIGFIPYAIITGKPVSAYFDMTCFKDFKSWIRPKDVIITAGIKSGTTMLLYISHLIRVKGNVEKYPFRDVNINTPWPALIHKPGLFNKTP